MDLEPTALHGPARHHTNGVMRQWKAKEKYPHPQKVLYCLSKESQKVFASSWEGGRNGRGLGEKDISFYGCKMNEV